MRLSVAIPDSSLSDESTKADKSRKASVLARACAIFGVQTIYVYNDGASKDDCRLLVTILRYLETPQFLRRRLFPKMGSLKFAGLLHPLKIPSHLASADSKSVRTGDIRDGIVLAVKGRRFVDVGIKSLVQYFGKTKPGSRITVQFKEGHPKLTVKEIPRSDAPGYWGYAVRERAGLYDLLSEWKGRTILTSRKAKMITSEQAAAYAKSDGPLLVAFGSPERGIPEILGDRIKRVQDAKKLNFFPNQQTETVRLEEALLGTLGIINSYGASAPTGGNG